MKFTSPLMLTAPARATICMLAFIPGLLYLIWSFAYAPISDFTPNALYSFAPAAIVFAFFEPRGCDYLYDVVSHDLRRYSKDLFGPNAYITLSDMCILALTDATRMVEIGVTRRRFGRYCIRVKTVSLANKRNVDYRHYMIYPAFVDIPRKFEEPEPDELRCPRLSLRRVQDERATVIEIESLLADLRNATMIQAPFLKG